jgi:hypothetical protein
MTKQPLRVTIIRSLLLSRQTSVELVVAAVALISGLWLIFPYWEFGALLVDVTGVGPVQTVIALFLILTSVLHSIFLFQGSSGKLTMLLLFMAMVFLTFLAIYAVGLASVIWVPFGGLAMLAGHAYLSLAMGDFDE